MRVQDPAKYAEVLFNIARPDEHWTADRVKSMFGGAEQDIPLQPAQIWVHLTYQSAFVDDAGKLQIRRDVYNLDGRTIAAIKSERVMIEIAPPERKREPEVASASSGNSQRTRHRRRAAWLLLCFPVRPADAARRQSGATGARYLLPLRFSDTRAQARACALLPHDRPVPPRRAGG